MQKWDRNAYSEWRNEKQRKFAGIGVWIGADLEKKNDRRHTKYDYQVNFIFGGV